MNLHVHGVASGTSRSSIRHRYCAVTVGRQYDGAWPGSRTWMSKLQESLLYRWADAAPLTKCSHYC
ncbi:MAG: hypothetical protein WCO86_04970 [Planctomycetota bacterium]